MAMPHEFEPVGSRMPAAVRPVTKEERRDASEKLLLILSRSTNPTTGKPYTSLELAHKVRFSQKQVLRKLNENGLSRVPLPEVRQGPIPENEWAFFQGLKMGGFSRERITWRDRKFIAIESGSKEDKVKRLLQNTAGTWGETHVNAATTRVYLASPTFDFMLDRMITVHFLESRARFAPFMMGALTARLSDGKNRFSISNELVLGRINSQFSRYFGFSPGNLRVEEATQTGRNKDVPVLELKRPGQVFGALLTEKSVITLPFLPEVARIQLPPTNGHR